MSREIVTESDVQALRMEQVPQFNPIQFLQQTIEQLKLELKGEKKYSRNLEVAIGELKEACGIARGFLAGVQENSENEGYISEEYVKAAIEDIVKLVGNADSWIEPIAEEKKQ